jgi:DNA-binding transcriptional LysR family regulator
MSREPNWDDLRIFLAIAETGSLSAAAETLRISQPTAGRRLRALEEDMGLQLVRRVSNRIELTDSGMRIHERALGMLGMADGVTREAFALAGREPDAVRISATGSIAHFLAQHLGSLVSSLGSIPIAINASRDRTNLARRDADIAIRMRRLPEDGDLVARRVAHLAFSIYAAGDEDRVIGLPRTDRRPSQSGYLDDWAQSRPVIARFDDVVQRASAAKSAGACTLLPCWLGAPDDAFEPLMPPPRELREDVYLITRRDSRDNENLAAVLTALVKLLKANADLLSGEGAPVMG